VAYIVHHKARRFKPMVAICGSPTYFNVALLDE